MTNDTPHEVDWTVRSSPLGPAAAPVPPPIYHGAPPTGPIPVPPYVPPPRRRRLGTGGWLLVVAAVLLIGAGATIGALVYLGKTPLAVPGVSRFTVHGTLTLSSDCGGLGYSDIRDGTEVTLTDDAGKVLSVGALAKVDDWNHASACTYNFTLPDVPAGGKFYGITISHRGTLHYTEQQLRDGPALTLGS